MKKQTARRIRATGHVLFVIYLGALAWVLFFAEMYGRTGQANEGLRYNLKPFREILRFWNNREILGVWAVFLNIVGNALIFLPFGIILPVLFRRLRSWWKITLLGAVFSLCVETAQLICSVGVFDVDDIFLNTLGAFLGYLIFAFCDHFRRKIYG